MVALVALVSVVVAVVVALNYGAFIALIPLIVGAIIAGRLGYSSSARRVGAAVRGDRDLRYPASMASQSPEAQPSAAAPASIEERLATVARLRESGSITETEAAERRAAILREL